MKRTSLSLALLALALSGSAASAQSASPPGAKSFVKQCSACHMAYPAPFLPARSWQAIMGNLPHHFGEDASLGPKTTARIRGYLVSHAADSRGHGSEILQGLAPDAVPLRITDLPVWRAIHQEMVASGQITMGLGRRSAANCTRCHSEGGGGE